MRRKKFYFKFQDGGTIAVYAFNTEEAEVLARAEAMRYNWGYEIVERW